MPRFIFMATLLSALTTLVAAMALRAADATLAVAAVASVAVLFTWYAHLHSTQERSSVELANPASILVLAVVGRRSWATVLPAVAAHVVGAVLGGLLALALDDQLGDTLVYTEPGLTLAAVGAAVVGLIGAWTTLSIDGGGPEALAAVPVAVGGAVLPIGLLTAFHPAAAIGLATAGLLSWDVALVAAAASLGAGLVGAFAVSWLVPTD
jgi:glycerol uptake facilitator-like aquaporin